MTILIDPPNAAGHGRLWSHLASDTSYEELHAFARRVGIPERGFDRDHYDVPEERYAAVVAAGARPVGSRELVQLLIAAGLRRRKSQSLHPRPPGRLLQRPAPLAPGSVVAVVTPAGPVDPDKLAIGIDLLRSLGTRGPPTGGRRPGRRTVAGGGRRGARGRAPARPGSTLTWPLSGAPAAASAHSGCSTCSTGGG